MTEKMLLLSLAAAGMLLTSGVGKAADQVPVITVDAAEKIGPVNPLVFGHNMEAADGRGVFSEPVGAVKFDKGGIKFGQGFWNPAARDVFPQVTDQAKKVNLRMMRYPGGCLAHNYDWKKAVGPLKERGDWQFGIDEFIILCRKLGAEPMFTITDYALPAEQIPQHAAELVEYLNAPATADHPWAMKRKDWGHPEPYGVKWFELGNESNHGNHKCQPPRKFSPDEYVAYANATGAAMRKIDPSIKLGVVTVPGGGEDYDCEWNRAVYKNAAPQADFVVVHFYAPGVDGLKPDNCFKTAMALSEQLEYRIGKYHETLKADCGKDLPLAVTEYNLGSTQNEPTFYRFSYTAGLMCADLMRLWLNPANRIATANYWHILNGYWGMYNCRDGKITARKASLPFYELWGRHFGSTLVANKISGSPVCEAPATSRLCPTRGDKMAVSRKLGNITPEKFNLDPFRKKGLSAVSSSSSDLTVDFDNFDKESYLEFTKFKRPAQYKADENCNFRITFEARFIPAPGNRGKAGLGLGMGDTRGWNAVHSAIAVPGIDNAREWKKFEGNFVTLLDCPGSTVLVRVEQIAGPISGKLEIRNLKLEAFTPDSFPAYQALTSCSSLSADGKTLYLMVFNKSPDAAIKTKIELKGFNATKAKSFELFQRDTGSLAYFTPKEEDFAVTETGTERIFPPHSMTAIEFYRK